MNEQEWITVFTTNDEIEANLKKGLLEQAEIPCILESSIYRPRSIAPIYNQFKLNIPKEHFEAAQDVLRDVKE